MSDLTLIIPAKNESESLPIVLNELKKLNYNINIVLHKSDHKTIESLSKSDVKIIYQQDLGYGDALIYGINRCETKYFCIFNADGSFDPSEIGKMFKFMISENLDFVFGSRYQKNASSDDDTIITLIGNYIFTTLGKIFFGLKLTDILYTFVIGKTKDANELNLYKKDFSFCVELPIKAKRNNKNIDSFSCKERKRLAGVKKVNAFKDGFLILLAMIKLFFNR